MADTNYNPNARYDQGPNSAGAGRVSNQSALQTASPTGLDSDAALGHANLRSGFSAAGVSRSNGGPNVAGAQKSYNGT